MCSQSELPVVIIVLLNIVFLSAAPYPEPEKLPQIVYVEPGARTRPQSTEMESSPRRFRSNIEEELMRLQDDSEERKTKPTDPNVKMHKFKIGGVPVIMYEHNSLTGSTRPALIFIHGGGWLCGTPTLDTRKDIVHSMMTSAVVFSIDYRLSREVPFPGPFEDCRKAATEIIKRSRILKIDNHNVAVMGGSSGGNLAAAVALALRDDPLIPPLKAQFILNPALQAFDFNTPSYIQSEDDRRMILHRRNMISFWGLYATGSRYNVTAMLNNRFIPPDLVEYYSSRFDKSVLPSYDAYSISTNEITATEALRTAMPLSESVNRQWQGIRDVYLNQYFSPLLADTFVGLPKAIIYAAQHDILRDDALLYAEQLRLAGVPVEVFLDQDGYHGQWWVHGDDIGLTDAMVNAFD